MSVPPLPNKYLWRGTWAHQCIIVGGIEGGARYALLEISGCFWGRKGHVGRREDGDNVEEVAEEGENEEVDGKALS